ncbi:MAG: ATP-dependent sacrificial sulfur transferase LarE [Nitrospirae bacterium]|nr:ATP-dependent sacrificial sulfur transferase LarE [Nitrospirota bacterium]
MNATLSSKLQRMRQLLQDMESVLVAFSGGIDSSLVLKVAHDFLGPKTIAVTSVSPTFPSIELEGARRVASQIGTRHLIVETDQLEIPDFIRNDAGRCYYCKTDLYQALGKLQRELKMGAMVDGTNLDDLGDDRPGIRAAREWGVRSPLVEAELSKAEIRALAKALGLSNWDKPAAACLSSRIPRGTEITREKLTRVELAEAVLFREGLKQFRVRDHGETARIEVETDELPAMLDDARRARVTAKLKELGFRFVTVDLEGYRRGSSNA